MPLLAAKLAPGTTPIAAAKVVSSQSPSMSSSSPQSRLQQKQSGFSSISTAIVSASSQAKRSVGQQQQQQQSSSLSSSSENKPRQTHRPHQQHQKQHAIVQQQNQQGQAGEASTTAVSVADSWLAQPNFLHQLQNQQKQQFSNQATVVDNTKNQQPQAPPLNLSGGLEELLSGLDKQQALEKLLQASINTSLAERAAQLQQQQQAQKNLQNHHQLGQDEEYHNLNLHQLLTSHTIAGDPPLQQGGVSLTSLISAASSSSSSSTQVSSSMQDLVGRLTKEFPNHLIKGQVPPGVSMSSSSFQQNSNSVQSSVYNRLGDSQQTAIDVDMDLEIGQLASIANDDSNLQRKQQGSHPSIHMNSMKQYTPVVCGPKSTAILSTLSSSSPSTQQNSIPSSTNGGARSLPPPPDYTPPPPYHGKSNQTFQAQHPSHSAVSEKSVRASIASSDVSTKQTVQNPFTFPTTGVTVHPDINSHGLLSYSLTPPSVCSSSTTSSANSVNNVSSSMSSISSTAESLAVPLGTSSIVKQEQFSSFREPMMVGATNQSFSSSQGRIQPDVMRQKGQQVVSGALTAISHKTQQRSSSDGEVPCRNSNTSRNTQEEDLRPMAVQPFNQRISNLSCLPVMNSTYRYRSSSVAAQRAR